MQLLNGETFNVQKHKKNSLKLTDSQINDKYSRGEIRIITEQARYPLDSITSMLSSGKYNLNPEYQRRKRWSVEQQSKLIESFIINVPIPPIFIYEVDFASYEIMDGLQRLTAIDDFYQDRYELTGLEEWAELNGRKYSELPKNIKEGIDRRYLSSIILLNETAKDPAIAESLKQMVFGRLNSGGDKLTAQESRNALFMGKFNNLCISLSANDNFRKLWNYEVFDFKDGNLANEDDLLKDESYRKMEDVEMVLRFFAYRHISSLALFKSQEDFLDDFLRNANSFSTQTLNELSTIFEETCKLVFDLFDKEALYMPDTGVQKRNTPTKTIYDPLMQVISSFLPQGKELLQNKKKLQNNLYKDINKLVYQSKSQKEIQLFDGKYNSRFNVQARIQYFTELIKDVIGK